MALEIDADWSQAVLFPPAIDDYVEADDPARFLRDFVAGLDLVALGIGGEPAREGRPRYAPALLLRLWIHGYMCGVWSARRLESLARRDVVAMWLCGGHRPDHNTVWRFWKRHKGVIGALFAQSVRRAVDTGAVGFALHALDGTKMLAAASADAALHRKDVEKAIAKLDERIAEIEAEVEASEQRDEETVRALDAVREKREEARASMAELEAGGAEHMQPGEPDARMMKCGNRVQWAYNAQAVVDVDSGVIVAAHTDNEAFDALKLFPMLEAAKQNTGRAADETAADGGYAASGAQLAAAENAGFAVTVPRPSGESAPFSAANFAFDREKDEVTCPLGNKLGRDGYEPYPGSPGEFTRRFRCTVHTDCPQRAQCCKGAGGRAISITPHREAVDRSRQKAATPRAREIMRRRSGSIERVFAHIKHNLGLRRFTVRGIEATCAQWHLTCLAYNIAVLARRNAPT